MKRAAVLMIAAVAALTAGCSSTLPTDPSPGVSVTEAPSPTAPPADDIVLSIDAVATAPNGAELAITLDVHRSFEASGPTAAELRTALTDACGPDFVTDDELDADSWGLVRIDVTAEATGNTAWPAELPTSLVTAPRGELGAAAIAASAGPFVTPEDPAGELGPCLVDQHLVGEGDGFLVLGIRGDFASDDAQGVFWNGYRYGVSTLIFGEPVDVTLRDCVIEKTPLGEELSAPEVGYQEQSDATECSAGIPPAR
ncbi:hypothetical protein [Homoserinimonas sp. A520]